MTVKDYKDAKNLWTVMRRDSFTVNLYHFLLALDAVKFLDREYTPDFDKKLSDIDVLLTNEIYLTVNKMHKCDSDTQALRYLDDLVSTIQIHTGIDENMYAVVKCADYVIQELVNDSNSAKATHLLTHVCGSHKMSAACQMLSFVFVSYLLCNSVPIIFQRSECPETGFYSSEWINTAVTRVSCTTVKRLYDLCKL